VTYLADDGHKKQSKGRTAPVGKGNQHAKATLHNHVGGMRTQLEGGAPAMGTATVATAPAMHAQIEGGAPAMGAATAATAPAMHAQMEGVPTGLGSWVSVWYLCGICVVSVWYLCGICVVSVWYHSPQSSSRALVRAMTRNSK